MLFRKIENIIYQHFSGDDDRVLLVDGARQVGKSFIVRKVARDMFPNFVEINLAMDKATRHLFMDVKSVDDFLLRVSSYGVRMGTRKDTVIFLDEIQEYPELLTLLKFLREDGRYTYVASGSLLGVALHRTTSIPMGSIKTVKMYPLDFEEFLVANGLGDDTLEAIRKSRQTLTSLSQPLHDRIMDLFRKYMLTGGLPQAVNTYLQTHNIMEVRNVQEEIKALYEVDAGKYDEGRKLKIARIYRLIPSALESTKRRIVFKDIEGKEGRRFSDYQDEFDYLIDSGIALEVNAVSQPKYPLLQSEKRNLLKLYLNDVGLLSGALYGLDLTPVLDRDSGVNLGLVYENAVAQELTAHGYATYYYDNKRIGEVDFLIDDRRTSSVVPMEIKSGKDYKIHSALERFLSNPDYDVKEAYVLSNSREIEKIGAVTYLPIYQIMTFDCEKPQDEKLMF